ncbi:MAG: hypothetical protein QNJ47_26240 [Nostocaceae cyanobacterium]|nr:hypothetical protein [Nostocaceae cyanobacterium]
MNYEFVGTLRLVPHYQLPITNYPLPITNDLSKKVKFSYENDSLTISNANLVIEAP